MIKRGDRYKLGGRVRTSGMNDLVKILQPPNKIGMLAYYNTRGDRRRVCYLDKFTFPSVYVRVYD